MYPQRKARALSICSATITLVTLLLAFTALGLSIYAIILSAIPGEIGARGPEGAKGGVGSRGATGAIGQQGISSESQVYGQISVEASSTTQILNLNDAVHLWTDASATAWAGNVNTSLSIGEIGAISASADRGDGTVRFTTSGAHGMAIGDPVSITSTTNHDEVWLVIAVSDNTHFEVNDAYSGGSESGEFQRGTGIQIAASGDYMVIVTLSAQATLDSPQIGHDIYLGSTHKFHTVRGYVLAAESTSMGALLTASAGDFLSIGLERTAGTGNIDVMELTLSIHRMNTP